MGFKLFTNQEGATSVLVIFMLIVLVTLGAFAITASNVNYKFSKQVSFWNQNYYELEKDTEIFLKEFDQMLNQTEEETVAFVLEKKETLSEEEFVKELNFAINKFSLVTDNENRNSIDNISMLYFTLLKQKEAELQQRYPNTVFIMDQGELVSETNFVSDTNADMNIKMRLKVLPLQYQFSKENERTVAQIIPNSQRFLVEERREWQKPVEFEEGIQLWDGTFE